MVHPSKPNGMSLSEVRDYLQTGRYYCAGCSVRRPWEHRCHRGGCSCASCNSEDVEPSHAGGGDSDQRDTEPRFGDRVWAWEAAVSSNEVAELEAIADAIDRDRDELALEKFQEGIDATIAAR